MLGRTKAMFHLVVELALRSPVLLTVTTADPISPARVAGSFFGIRSMREASRPASRMAAGSASTAILGGLHHDYGLERTAA